MKYPSSQYEEVKQAEAAGMLPGQQQCALNEDEIRLRDALIRQHKGSINCAPGSPLYDRVMGTNLHIPPHDRSEEPATPKNYIPIPLMVAPEPKIYLVVAFVLGWSIGVICVLGTMAVLA